MHADFTKARNVTCLVYLDDCGHTYGELLEFLDELHMPCVCSPLHDADTYTKADVKKWIARHTDKHGKLDEKAIKDGIPEVDQAKKQHVHVMLSAPGPMTPEWYQELFSEFCEVGYWQKVNSTASLVRYFAHLDQPDKHQYSALEIHGFGGFDLSPLLKTNKFNNIETLLDILDYVITNKIRHYNKLVRWAVSTGDIDTIACVTGRASFFANYFQAASQERKEKREREKRLRENACSANEI